MLKCFYCDGNHFTNMCPQKNIERNTGAIQELGYKSLQTIDRAISVHEGSIEIQHDLTRRVVEGQNEIAGAISEGFAQVGNEIVRMSDEISGAIHEFTDVFRWAHAEAMWRAEQQQQILTGIHDMIKNSRATDAEELLKMGEEAMKVGMLDETLNLLKKAVDQNPLDYRIYITMGYAYLEKDDLENALNRFEYALKNSRTDYYKGYSLLLISRVKYCMDKLDEAIQCIEKSLGYCQDIPEAYYQYSVYLSKQVN